MELEVDKWFEKHDANMSGFFEKEELRALVTSMAKEELGLDAGAVLHVVCGALLPDPRL